MTHDQVGQPLSSSLLRAVTEIARRVSPAVAGLICDELAPIMLASEDARVRGLGAAINAACQLRRRRRR